MKYRALSATGDYQFGRLDAFLVDTPAAVAQAVKTRLALWTGEWFLDADEGTPYVPMILGAGTQGTRDDAVRQRILDAQGVQEIVSYYSNVDHATRAMTATALVQTIYGQTSLTVQVT